MGCVVEFIYQAAMRTPTVVSPAGKEVKYEPAPEGNLSGFCWLCGCKTYKGLPRNKVIRDTFTDGAYARAPWSNVVCPHCAWALDYKTLRNYSILAYSRGMEHPSRATIRRILLGPPEPPFALIVAESGQKWLHFKGRVSYQREAFPVRFEELDITVRPREFAGLLGAIEALYATFTKDEIATGEYKSHRIREFGVEGWENLENIIEPYRKSGVFRLALFVAQREEDEEECSTASTQATKMLL